MRKFLYGNCWLLTDLICKYTKLDRKLYSLSFEGRNAVEESVTLHIENHDELLCTPI